MIFLHLLVCECKCFLCFNLSGGAGSSPVWGQLAQLNCKKPHVMVLVLILKPELGHMTPSASAPGYYCIILGGRCNSIVGESEPEVP